MRTFFVFFVLVLVLCVGCSRSTPESNNDATGTSVEMPAPNKSEPLVEPLVPRVVPPSTEEAPEEATGITSAILGKYTAQVVVLPPVEDMVAQIDEYIAKMGESLDNLDGSPRYAADSSDIVRDSNALALLALAVGLADTDSKYKKSASHIIAAAKNFAAAKTLEEGQKAYEVLKASLTNMDKGQPLSWADKVADLAPAMKALPNLNSAVKRVTDTERKLTIVLDRRAQQVLGQIAAMAAISQGTIPNVVDTSKPDATAEWKKYCEEFRDAAINVSTVARQYAQDKADYSVFRTAFTTMTEKCDDCHQSFYQQAMGMQ